MTPPSTPTTGRTGPATRPSRSGRSQPGPQVLPDCCQAHDGPHIEGCYLTRTHSGATHPGACLLAAPFRITEHGRELLAPAVTDRPRAQGQGGGQA